MAEVFFMAARFFVLLKAETLLATDLMTARRPFFSVMEVVLCPGLFAALGFLVMTTTPLLSAAAVPTAFGPTIPLLVRLWSPVRFKGSLEKILLLDNRPFIMKEEVSRTTIQCKSADILT